MTHGQIFDDIFLSSFGIVILRTQQMTNEEIAVPNNVVAFATPPEKEQILNSIGHGFQMPVSQPPQIELSQKENLD